jgi:alpha-glucosidase
MRIHLLSFIVIILINGCKTYRVELPITLQSPDKKLELSFDLPDSTKNTVSFEISYNNNPITNAGLELTLKNQPVIKNNFVILSIKQAENNKTWQRVWGKRKNVIDHYNELIVELQEKRKLRRRINLIFRAYNDGLAFRYELPVQQHIDTIILTNEKLVYGFNDNHVIWGSFWDSFNISQEKEFIKTNIGAIKPNNILGTPLLVKPAENIWLAMMEANITDWPASGYTACENQSMSIALRPSYRPDDTTVVVRTYNQRFSPWQVLMIAGRPIRFIESDILQNLNEPCKIKDVSWIKPGVSAWDWWWCGGYAPDVPFKLGCNTETMQYFIDFAAEMEWQYQLIDWQWYGNPFDENGEWVKTCDITRMNPDIDIPGLVDYAAKKNIRLFLWLEWHHADRQMEEAFALYEKWGIAGVKIDFMDRNDQDMVKFYHRVARTAAQHHLLVDFHGAYMPDGLSRTYPNLITREGVLGNEYNKWSDRVTPEHCLTIPFTRMLGGEMDFTPGGFINKTKRQFTIVGGDSPAPNVMGTRCFQLAMFVVYESALTVFCESPYNVRNQPGSDFLKGIPTSWDETIVLDGEIADFIIVARKSGNTWYLGGMSAKKRTINVPLSFLDEKPYQVSVWMDSPDADENPQKLIKGRRIVENSTTLYFDVAEGGGFVAILEER